ncbi:MAG: BlaI/MecI/CopY family transcriptional regulator [Bdellovibrionaceae bacterium]|nr:BlaI/MecI/CopY family transcriptional regulator [Pseudobdellovibrionaceae bacterium]
MSAKKNQIQSLTEAETEVMNVVWEKSPTTSREIFDVIKIKKDVAYTTVATTVKILEDKKFLSSLKEGKAHSFKAEVPKKEYSRFAARNLINKLFGGMTSGLVMNLLSDGEMSEAEREAIKKLFEESV